MKSLRILVAEDDAIIGALLAEVLAGLGHNVCATAVSEDGTVMAAFRHDPDLMIVDVHLMPGSGLSAVATIMQTTNIPHFFITGGDAHPVRTPAAVLQKPFREIDIVQAIRQTVGVAATT